ncbi:MAG: class C beta-lactamase-related serine hydrolase [Bacteroidetes bacterium]|nr:MAG: class C beta-lactamase-related serine hydrolase [Bacteroidota bacterium]
MMKRIVLWVLLAACLLPGGLACRQQAGPPVAEVPAYSGAHPYPAAEWQRIRQPDSVGYAPDMLQQLRTYIIDSTNTTGLMVVLNGKVLYEYGDVEEVSYLASCRKSILAMLYGKYVHNGQIDLNKTVAELGLEEDDGLLPLERQATVEHLITARSGIYHPASNGGDNSADAPPRGSQQPGTYFLYNNWDFNAAGEAFERMTGKNLYDALEQDLARPLGMQDFDRQAQRKLGDSTRSRYLAYHIWLSTRDMARIGYLMLRRGNWAGQQLIPAEWVDRITSVVTPLEEMNPEGYRKGHFGYGYMWWVWDGPRAVGPFEGAYAARGYYGQYIAVFPALDMVIAHKTKAAYQRHTSWRMFQGIYERILAARIPNT